MRRSNEQERIWGVNVGGVVISRDFEEKGEKENYNTTQGNAKDRTRNRETERV